LPVVVGVILLWIAREASLPCFASRRSRQKAAGDNPAYPLASYLLARSGRKSTGKRSENYSGRDTKSPDSTFVMVGADPLAARELPKAIILPRQGNFLPNLTASRRSFYLAASLPSPTEVIGCQATTAGKQRRIAMRATASPDRFFKIRHNAGGHFRAGIMDPRRNRLRTKYLRKINGLGVEATSGIEPEYTVLQTVA
jgi:hypothetical protein